MSIKPNKDSADNGNMAGILKAWLRSFIRENLDDMLPAKIISYDDTANRAVVQPLIMVGTTDGQKISRSHIAGVPVFRFGGGGFFIRYPLKPGDFGWLKANDRDISLMLQRGGGEDWANTERLHSFSDSMFFPDTLKDWAIDGDNSDAMVIQSLDGGVCIALHNGKITMKAPKLEVDIPETEWIGDINQVGNTERTGSLNQVGAITASGGGTFNGGAAFVGGSVTHNGTDIGDSHTHGGVASGGSNTSTPN